MSGTYANLNYHIVFSTKDRNPFITAEIQPRLYEYIGGIIRKKRGVLFDIGGMKDHVHLLLRWRPKGDISDLLRDMKSRSSEWVHETFHNHQFFGWQEGYAAFSVSQSNCKAVSEYIVTQATHHQKMSFKKEYVGFLKVHEIEYDERFIWD